MDSLYLRCVCSLITEIPVTMRAQFFVSFQLGFDEPVAANWKDLFWRSDLQDEQNSSKLKVGRYI